MGNTGSRKSSMSAMDGGMREKKVKAELCNLSKTRRLQAWEQGERQRKHHARDEHHAWEDLVHNVNAVWSERVVAGLDKALDDVMTIGGCMPQSRTPDSARDKVVPAETRNLRGVHSHRAHKFTDGRKDHRGSNAGNSDRRVGQQAPRPNDALGTDIDIREAAVVDGDDRVLLADGDDRVLLAEEAKRKKGAAAGVPAIRRVKSTVRNMIAEVKEREEKTRMHEMTEHKKETMIRRRTNALKGLHINVKFANSHDEQDGPASVTSPSA